MIINLNIRYVANIFFFFFFLVNQPILTISAECLEGQFGYQGYMYSSVDISDYVTRFIIWGRNLSQT